MDNDHPEARFPFARTDPFMGVWFPEDARTDPFMGIRRRTRLARGNRQEAQDEISIEDQSIGGKGLPYSITRYLNQPLDDDEWSSRLVSRERVRICQAWCGLWL